MVRFNDSYGAFVTALDAVAPDRSRFPQRTPELLGIYAAAREALPLFGAVLQTVARRASAVGACQSRVESPLKHVFRVLFVCVCVCVCVC